LLLWTAEFDEAPSIASFIISRRDHPQTSNKKSSRPIVASDASTVAFALSRRWRGPYRPRSI